MDALTPLDGRYADRIKDLTKLFSEYALNEWRVFVEVQYFRAITDFLNVVEWSSEDDEQLSNIFLLFNKKDAEAIKEIEKKTKHDVKAVEYWVKEKIHTLFPQANTEFVHFGLTSEDVNNLALGRMVQTAFQQIVKPCYDLMSLAILRLAKTSVDSAMLSHTHGQAATPTTMGKELTNYIFRLTTAFVKFNDAHLLGKCNGAVGNYNALVVAYPDRNWESFCREFVEEYIGRLTFNPFTTQIESHDSLCEFLGVVATINTILIGFVRDVWGYISMGYFTQQVVGSEVGSSTMPHKVNPIDFENAEGNLGLANALLRHMMEKLPISRFQRDLSDSTVLRNIGTAFGYTLVAWQSITTGLEKLKVDTEFMRDELDQHWELLAEPIQTVMRRYGLDCPYEQLKALTRGVKDKSEMRQQIHQFINNSALPEAEKTRLCALTPATYTGLASKLASKVCKGCSFSEFCCK